MSKLTSLVWALGLFANLLLAAPLSNKPVQLVQPDGSKVAALVSGDEFYQRLHDADDYTIVKDDSGWYCYAVSNGERPVPSSLIAGQADPHTRGLEPGSKISETEYQQRRAEWPIAGQIVRAPHTGPLNTLAIFIRFSDQAEFTAPRSDFDAKFNSPSAASLKSFYAEATYGKLDITSHFFPACDLSTNLSYSDAHPRGYYLPYTGTNTVGYSTVREARLREHTLIKNAVEAISAQAGGIDFDQDDDGFADNLCIITRGNEGSWADVGLWPHTGVADSYDIRINGARIFNYEFQFEGWIEYGVLSHEMFHVLGSPDLYRYTDNPVDPAGSWDIMATGGGHMGAYMKYRYGNQEWISKLPEIKSSGKFWLQPLQKERNNCYLIQSPYTDKEFFLLEYRNKSGLFESELPGTGLLVYRINPAGDNSYGPPDQVYIYRSNGTLNINGSLTSAHFSAQSGRTAINDQTTNPKAFLSDGSAGGLSIKNIGSAGDSISFEVEMPECQFLSPADSSFHAALEPLELTLSAPENIFAKVEILANGVPLTTLTAAPYSYIFTPQKAGAVRLTVRAYAQNGITVTAERTLFISKDAPAVYLVSPAAGAQVKSGTVLSVSARAGFPGHQLTKAEFYLNNQLQATLNSEPYSAQIPVQGSGQQEVKVVVYSDAVTGTAAAEINVLSALLSESFEGIWPPEGWSVNTPTYGWYRTTKAARNGSAAAAVRHYHAQGTAILESPAVALQGGEQLEFYWMDRDADITRVAGLDTTYLEIFSQGEWRQLGFNSVSGSFQPAFVRELYDLAPYKGETVRFRWRDVTDESVYAQGCILDDVTVGTGLVSIPQSKPAVQSLAVSSYPNPFNSTTRLTYTLTAPERVNIELYNAAGQMVVALYTGERPAGIHTLDFSAVALNSGLYFVQVRTARAVENRRLLLLK